MVPLREMAADIPGTSSRLRSRSSRISNSVMLRAEPGNGPTDDDVQPIAAATAIAIRRPAARYSPTILLARQLRRHVQRVRLIQFLEHGIGQRHAIQLPERVIPAIVVEVLVGGLEDAPVVRVLLRLE